MVTAIEAVGTIGSDRKGQRDSSQQEARQRPE